MPPRTVTIDAPPGATDISDLDFWSPILSDPEDWSEFQGMLGAVAARAEKGGEGSGHFEHEGRPGKVGGSRPSGRAEPPPTGGQFAISGFFTGSTDLSEMDEEALAPYLKAYGLTMDDIKEMFKLEGARTEITFHVPSELQDGYAEGPDLHLSIQWSDESGNGVGNASRYLEKSKTGKLSCYNSILSIKKEFSGHGYGTKLYEQQIEVLRKRGYDRITLLADSTIGRYAWAKLGFDYRSEMRGAAAANARRNFLMWVDNMQVPEPEGGWPEFNSPYDFATYQHPQGHEIVHYELQNVDAKGTSFPVGKAFMLDMTDDGHGDWSAELKL